MASRDILLTGLPRSGTTLVCHLLNKLPDAVALAEPMNVGRLSKLPTRAAILDGIAQFAAQQRASLLTGGVAVSRHVEGTVQDNLFAPARGPDGLRHFHAAREAVCFDKPLNPDFALIIKHPAAFTALLPDLAGRFPCYAVIRNPLSVLASWNSTRMPVNDGHAPAAEQHDPGLKQTLSTLPDRFDRQVALLWWYFGQYHQHLAPDHILRYEDIIESGGGGLAAIAPSAASLKHPLENRNRNTVYDWDAISPLAERLLMSEGPYWKFYTRADIRGLLT